MCVYLLQTYSHVLQTAGSRDSHFNIVLKYMRILRTPGSDVVGSFVARRAPADVVMGVLASNVIDAATVACAKELGIVLFGPSGPVLQSFDSNNDVSLLSAAAARTLGDTAIAPEEENDDIA